jgi:hypothetical protein
MKQTIILSILVAISFASTAQFKGVYVTDSRRVSSTNLHDTIDVDTSKIQYIRIQNRILNLNQRDTTTVLVYVYDRIDTTAEVDILVEGTKGRISKGRGRYIYAHKIYTTDGKSFYNFPAPQRIIGAIDNRQRKVKPYIPNNGNGR